MDKEEYWKRRKEGKRGQGDKPVLSVMVEESDGMNRKQKRTLTKFMKVKK